MPFDSILWACAECPVCAGWPASPVFQKHMVQTERGGRRPVFFIHGVHPPLKQPVWGRV